MVADAALTTSEDDLIAASADISHLQSSVRIEQGLLSAVTFGDQYPRSARDRAPSAPRAGGHRHTAALLAGGQSLMPLLNRRRLRPEMLIDLNRVADIDGISFRDGFLRIE
ncbi:MAG: FAD binding domain-containing protein, partial [Pseudolabrys sp.]